ncbi:AAA family ATPase [Crossiella cryophila]|uniref:Nuclease SbcCD subunit C n=1 Tax=Crossiella cryophila TaxID=43355 RepID=A0A7W7C8I4_9PSEU|nr:AAA family ATPase [Crossiella cryophila]MBB4676465.1 hypothetical protein [Crossiella cryophila]
MTVAELDAVLLPGGVSDAVDEIVSGVLRRCRESAHTDEDVLLDALAAGPWALRSVEVSGFRGAANGTDPDGAYPDPFRLELPNSAGVVVVHAPNGTGKSTITDALEVALFGGIKLSPAFDSTDARRPTALHADAERADVLVILDNDRGDRLRLNWRLAAGVEKTAVTWYSHDAPEDISEIPGSVWAAAVAARRPVVGYDHLAHRLRGGRLADFVQDTLSLGDVWWQVLNLLKTDHDAALHAHDEWLRVRGEVTDALELLDEEFARRYPEIRAPRAVELPETPTEDVATWFSTCFGSTAESMSAVEVDRLLSREVAQARASALAALNRSERAQAQSNQELWSGGGLSALGDLLDHLSAHEKGPCPICGGATGDWSDKARSTVADLRLVREEFNLAQAELHALGELLVDKLLPLLRIADCIAHTDGVTDRLCALIEPLIDRSPRSEHDRAWQALRAVAEDEEFDHQVHSVLTKLGTVFDELAHWRAARRRCCLPLVEAQTKHGAAAVRLEDHRKALDRVAHAFDAVHGDRRNAVQSAVNEQLHRLLADVQFGGLTLTAGASDHDGFGETTTLQLSLNGRDTGMGLLSAGQYNALVLALVLGVSDAGPFRFLVLDDPVHAFDEFRTDIFAELVTRRAAAGGQVVLLTHDTQLVDMLRHHVPDLCLIKLARDEAGNIEQVDATHPWQPLIADARALLRSNTDNTGRSLVLSDTSAGLLVLGFCRQAIDAALREFVLAYGHRAGNSRAALAGLNRAFSTNAAIDVAKRLAGEGHPAQPVLEKLDPRYVHELNGGAHADTTTLQSIAGHLADRVQRAEKFCIDLLSTVDR